MALVLRLVLAVLLAVGGSLTIGTVTERTMTVAASVPCYDAGAVEHHASAPDPLHRQVDRFGHCTTSAGICCTMVQPSDDLVVEHLVTDVTWAAAADHDHTDQPGEPATPPPRV